MRVSVLVNNHNNGRYLAACLESVVAQTRHADEIIVHDDGSTDNSEEVLRTFTDRITVIKSTRDENHPGSACFRQALAIRKSFQASIGDVIFLLDGDDRFHPNRIERYLSVFAAESPSKPLLVQAPMQVINGSGQPTETRSIHREPSADPLKDIYRRNDADVFYSTSALAFDRAFLEEWLPIVTVQPECPTWIDVRLTCAAVLSGKVVTLQEELGDWRWHAASNYTSQSKNRSFLLLNTIRRTRWFNRICRQLNRPQISLWRNRRFFRQCAGMVIR